MSHGFASGLGPAREGGTTRGGARGQHYEILSKHFPEIIERSTRWLAETLDPGEPV